MNNQYEYDLFSFDKELRQVHGSFAGIDEAGRGPIAGPLVASAVLLPPDIDLPGVTDSKKLTDRKRRELYIKIKEAAIQYSIGVVESDEIDEKGMATAIKLSFQSAAKPVESRVSIFAIDGLKVRDLGFRAVFFIKGDLRSLSIAAASIIAKVTRDDIMLEMAERYPGYGFESNKGYGSRQHLQALRELGPIPIHRKSFAPLKNMIHQLPLGLSQ